MPAIAKVVVERVPDREFDYLIPEHLQGQIAVGSQVAIPFGRTEARGYVVALADSSPHPNLKAISDRVGRRELVDPRLLELARWMALYYVAPVANAIRTVLPAVVRQRGKGFQQRLMVIPAAPATEEATLAALRERSPRQASVLDELLAHGEMFLSRLVRAARTTAATVRALEKKGFVHISRRAERHDPLAGMELLRTGPLALMEQQAAALALVRQSIDTQQPPVVLLHGVTGSGKTEVYLQAIQHVLDRGKSAIVLVPEIALTPQTIERFRSRFGEAIAVLHSALSGHERYDEWHRLKEGQARIAIGARSALFAPMKDLGLIVVDEEHESTYKQEEAPRYHARDAAVMRGRLEGCAVVLGSATPALETTYNAQVGKYNRVVLPHRVDHRTLPRVQVVDMRVEAEREGHPVAFSSALVEAIRARLDRAEQTMLFLNRRGYASSLVCRRCGHVARCRQCSVALTYHKTSDRLLCHICGESQRVPRRCPNAECRDPSFSFTGLGTQRIEAIMARLFPRAQVQRMDSDTTARKHAHSRILGDFRTGKIDILVGTQMIAKGLHFPNVTLVGVIFADLTLHMPDFRAAERTFQLLTQVAGRAGRGDVAGEVIIQTYTPHHPAIQAARRLDYDMFYDQEIEFRREFQYPPFMRLACVTIRSRSEDKARLSAQEFARHLGGRLAPEVALSDPSPAPLARMRGEYRFQLLLRAPRPQQLTVPLAAALQEFRWPDGVHAAVDMDAQALL